MTTNRATLKKASYQYLMDHTYPTANGLVVNVLLPKEKVYYNKLKLRERGVYVRKDEQALETDVFEYKKLVKELNWRRMNDYKLRQLKKSGPLFIRFVIWLRARLAKIIQPHLDNIVL